MWKCKNIVMWAMTYRCNMACEYCYVRELVKNYDELDDAACLAVAHKIADDPTFRPDAVWLTDYLSGVSALSPEEIVYHICLHAVGYDEHDDCSAVALRIETGE